MTRGFLTRAGLTLALTASALVPSALAQTQGQTTIPVPRPFPQASQPNQPPATTTTPTQPAPTTSTATPPATTSRPAESAPVPAAPVNVRPSDRELGVTVYPAAEFIDSYDAGRGQRYYLFGTNAAYADIVGYFRNTLKDGGHELFKAPAMQQFDLGRYREDTMAYPPSVVVKDYTWTLDGQPSAGYLVIDGAKEKHFKTIIQVVPATGK